MNMVYYFILTVWHEYGILFYNTVISHVIMLISKVWLFGFPILFLVQNYSMKVLIFQNKVFGNLNKVTVRQARSMRWTVLLN